MNYFHFKLPPFPYFEESNKDTYLPGDTHIDRQNFEFFDFIFVTKGCLYLTEETNSFAVKANQGLILQPYLHHYSQQPVDQLTDFYWVHFQTTGIWETTTTQERLHPKELILPQFFTLTHADVLVQHFEKLYELYKVVSDEQLLEREALLLQLFKVLMTNLSSDFSPAIRDLAKEAAILINEGYTEPLEIQEIADRLRFHPTYVSRCMKKVYGVSAKQYLQELRMNNAQSLLKNTNQGIEEIAYASGFNSLAFFSKSFTKKYGLAPSAFRNHYRK